MAYTESSEQIFTTRTGVWRRTGYCCRCGSCCEDCPANLLKKDGDVFTCLDRNHPYYLMGCNVWPTEPELLVNHPKCTYVFEKVNGN